MEALLEKEGDVENWNDDRLDELSETMKEGFERIDRRFERVEDRLDKLFYIQIFFLISFSAALISHAV